MKKNKKNKRVKPDDYFAWGPFELARFGKNTVMRSHLNAEQLAEVHRRMAQQFPTLVAELDALVLSIAHQIARLPPADVLQHAWWDFAMANLGMRGHKVDDFDLTAAMRMIDYVQSVIASFPPAPYSAEISKEDWVKLNGDVETLFRRLTVEYQACLTGTRKAQDPALNMELEEFRMRAEVLWLNIRGKRYHMHERQALLEVLSPHSDLLLRLFGIDAEGLVNELGKILSKLTRGLMDSVQEFDSFREDFLDRLEKLASENTGLSMEELRDKIFEDDSQVKRSNTVVGQLFGMDLFDVAKNTALPQPLIDALTWSPGEDTEFFAQGEFSGWPLRIWPIMKRPFIRLNGSVYCFDMFSLFDNIYRVLRRIIIQQEPAYSNTWNERQKAITEELPFTYLNRLLPGASIYRPVYYRWSVNGGAAQWHEADGLIVYGDHLLVVEIKAGAFTFTSPANDLQAHLASLKTLVQAPARQGSRFVDYLESAPEVSIADESHNEIGRLRRGDFRHVTICAVTLDAFGSFAARAQHLKPIGVDVGNRPVWPLSIDDLRVYSELFDNPLSFLHFVEHRVRAGQSKDVDLDDEMDHLGLYVVQNNYSMHAARMRKENALDRIRFDGFRTPIDHYYAALMRGEKPKLVKQKMPGRLAEVISFLGNSNKSYRGELASFLLDGDGEFRDSLGTAIEDALRENSELHRAHPLTFYGAMAVTIYIWSPSAPRNEQEAADHARVVLAAKNESSRRLLELEYSGGGGLVDVHMKQVSLAGLSTDEIERIREGGTILQNRRIRQAQAKEKIGRNDPCPCGSGKKFKRCHG